MRTNVLLLCLLGLAAVCCARRTDVQVQEMELETVEMCSVGFVAIAGRCYLFGQSTQPWDHGRRMCAAQEADLASVVNDEQYEGLLNHIAANFPGVYWIGGKYTSGSWLWIDTQKTVAPQWWGRPPQNSNNQCAYFCSFTRKYWSSPCSVSKKFICEKEMEFVIKEVPAV